MFAPPDPTTRGSAPSIPPPETPLAPTLPSVPSTPVETAPVTEPLFAAEPEVLADVVLPKKLVPVGWLRRLTIWSNAGSVPGFFVGDYVGASLVATGLVGLLLWSALAAVNVRRARLQTRHGSPPHPLLVTFSWFVAPAVAVAVSLGIVSLARWTETAAFEEQGSRSLALAAAVFLGGLAILIAAYQPYRMLAKCSKWVNADPGRFRRWFVAPIVGGLLAVVVQVLAGLVVLSDNADGSSSGASVGAVLLWLVALALPWLAWLIFASRAMRSLDLATTHAHGRAVREARDPSEVDPELIGSPVAAPPQLTVPSA